MIHSDAPSLLKNSLLLHASHDELPGSDANLPDSHALQAEVDAYKKKEEAEIAAAENPEAAQAQQTQQAEVDAAGTSSTPAPEAEKPAEPVAAAEGTLDTPV